MFGEKQEKQYWQKETVIYLTGLNIYDFVIKFNVVENIRNCKENIEPFSFLLPHIMLTL